MSETPPPPALPVTREKREQTIQTLVAGFAEDRMTLEEFERRLDIAHRTLNAHELERLTTDLPAPAPATPAPAPQAARPAVPAAHTRETQVLVAIMGGVDKKGRWTPARRTIVLAFMGGAVLDLREADIPAGVTEIAIFTIWGGVEIIVPPGVNVDVSGVAIMGAFEQQPGTEPLPPDAPTVRVSGFALMAGVEIFVRYPGETAKDARRRIKEAQRQRNRRLPSE
jgi:hypothetical protein